MNASQALKTITQHQNRKVFKIQNPESRLSRQAHAFSYIDTSGFRILDLDSWRSKSAKTWILDSGLWILEIEVGGSLCRSGFDRLRFRKSGVARGSVRESIIHNPVSELLTRACVERRRESGKSRILKWHVGNPTVNENPRSTNQKSRILNLWVVSMILVRNSKARL